MSEAWHEGLSDDTFKTEVDKAYEEAFTKIREGLAQGLDFDSACASIDVKDEELRKVIIDDMLKVLIAEEHFARKIPLDKLAKNLKISIGRLESAKSSMLEEVKNESVKAFYNNFDSKNL